MTTPGFARAERAYLEPPEERSGVCGNCGCKAHAGAGCDTEDCQCVGYREYDVYQARDDAESDRAYEEWKEARND